MSIFTTAFNKCGGHDDLAPRFPGGPARLHWRKAVCLTGGDPAAGTVTVWQPVWDAAGPLWQAAWRTGS